MKEPKGHSYSFEQLQAFADGALDDALARDIGRHLAGCGECRAAVDRLRALDARIGQAESADAPAGYFETFGSRVAGRIAARRAAKERPLFRFPLWGLIPAAAAAGLVLVIALRTETPVPELTVRLPPATRFARTESAPATGLAGSPVAAAGKMLPAVGQKEARHHDPAAADAREADAVRTEPASDSRAKLAAPEPPLTGPSPAAPTALQARSEAVSPPAAGPARGTPRRDSRMAIAARTAIKARLRAPAEPATARAIVIHLPDGGAYCPAPEVAAAIAIELPTDD